MVKKKKSGNKYGLNRRLRSLVISSLVALFAFVVFGGSIGSYSFDGVLPRVQDYIFNKTEPVRTTKQANSGLYFQDGSPIPEYSGVQSIDINGGVPFFGVEERNLANTGSFEEYRGNDYLGRALGVVSVFSSKDIVSSEGRPDLPDPVGWVGRSEGGVFDRSHLKAYTFGGSNNKDNLVTGTIALNQKYMVEVENVVRNLLKETNQSVIYRVTPYYLGDELLPRGVLMEVYSSQGTLSICKYIYNVQDGYSINYSDGGVIEN